MYKKLKKKIAIGQNSDEKSEGYDFKLICPNL